MVSEDLLHFIWKFQLFKKHALTTENGESLIISEPGKHNHDAGPDFTEAKVKIGDTLWAGHVEIHVNSSDWYKHNHHKDETYHNVILHVVFEHDKEINHFVNSDRKQAIPTLCLKNIIPAELLNRYRQLSGSISWIPCSGQIENVNRLAKTAMIEKCSVERLRQRVSQIEKMLQATQNNWSESFYRLLARRFGLRVNSEAFQQLAERLPEKILAKHKNDNFQIEALLFGQAGFLENLKSNADAYPLKLKKEYSFLRKKYKLTPMNAQNWKFMRMRPSNFPGVRLSQFAHLVIKSSHLFSKVLEVSSIKQLQAMFEAEASEYWDEHYSFNTYSKDKRKKKLGKQSIHNLLINTVIPFVFAYGYKNNNTKLKSKALNLLQALPAEKNKIITQWSKFKMPLEHAADSQGLIQLKEAYCNQKKCLDCIIGGHILSHIEIESSHPFFN